LSAGSCWTDGPKHNVWFSVVAPASGIIQATIDRGGSKGTLQYAYIALWEADGVTEVGCGVNSSANDDISLLSTGLTPGDTYYISVDNRYINTTETFTLCLTDQPTMDYPQGAVDLDPFMNKCYGTSLRNYSSNSRQGRYKRHHTICIYSPVGS